MQPSIDALSSIGIAVKDSNGEMKSATTIIDNLAERWGSLSAETQQNTAVTLAGRFQLSRFLALMNNHKMAIDATETALHSEGSAMQENAKHILSLSSRIERMKAAWEELALVMGNAVITDSLVGLLNIATSLGRGFASLSNTVGILPVLLPAIALSVYALSAAFRQLIVSTALTVAGIFGIVPAASAATGGIGLLSGAITGLKFSIRGLLASTGVGLVAVAIGFGLEALVSTLGNTKDRVEELADSYSDANQKVFEANRIRELSAQYDKLTKSTSLTNDEKVKLSKVESELSTKYGIILKSINEQTDAYAINSQAIAQRIGLLQEEVKIEREKAKLNYESQKTAIEASIAAKRKEKKEAEDAYNEANKRYEDFLNSKKNNGVITNKENRYSETLPMDIRLDPNNNKQSAIIQSMGEELAKKVKDAKNLWNTATGEFQKSINSKTAYTNSQLQNYADTLEVSGVKITAKTRVLLDSFSSVAAMDGIEISDDKIKGIVEFFQNTKITSIDEAVAALSTRLPAGVKLSGDAIKNLENNLNKLDFGKYGNGVDETSESFGEMGSNVGVLSTKMESAAQTLKPLNQALHDVTNGQSLSSDAITDLIIQYPQLTSAIRMTADGYTIEKDALNEVRLAKIKKAQSDLLAERDSTKITLSNSISRITAYGIELSNINTLAQAKSKIANIDFNKFQETTNPKSGLADTLGITTTIGSSFIENKKKQEDAAVDGLRSAITEAEKTSSAQLKLLSDMLNNPKFGIGDAPEKKEKAAKQETQATLQTLQDFTKEQIENINSVISARENNIKSLEKQIQTVSKAEDYNKSTELTNQLLAEQRGKIDDITSANQKLSESADKIRNNESYSKLAEQFSSLDGDKMVGFDQWFNDGANASDAYTDALNEIRQQIIGIMGDGKNLTVAQQNTVKELENQEKLYGTIFSQIQSFKKAHADNNVEIQKTDDIVSGLTESMADLIQKSSDAIFNNSKNWINDQTELSKLSAQEQIDAWNRVVANHQDSEIEFTRIRDANKNDTVSAESQIQSIRNSNSQKRLDAEKEIYRITKELRQKSIDDAADEVKKYDSLITASSARQNALEQNDNDSSFDVNKFKEYNKELLAHQNILNNKLISEQKHEQAIRRQMNAVDITSDEWEGYNDQLKQSIMAQIELTGSIQGVNDKLKEQQQQLADDIVDVIKEGMSKRQELELDAIDKQMEALEKDKDDRSKLIESELDALEKAHDAKMDIIDEEIDKLDESYNAQLKLIDLQEDNDDYAKNLSKSQSEAQKIQEQINALSLSDDIADKAKRRELQEKLDGQLEDISDMQHDREIDLRKKSLQDELDKKKKEKETQKETSTFKIREMELTYNKAKEFIDKEKKDIAEAALYEVDNMKRTYEQSVFYLEEKRKTNEVYWTNELNNERYFSQLRQEVLRGEYANARAELEKLGVFYSTNMKEIGTNISLNVIDKITQLNSKMSESSGLLQSYFTNVASTVQNTLLTKLNELVSKLTEINNMSLDKLKQNLSDVYGKIAAPATHSGGSNPNPVSGGGGFVTPPTAGSGGGSNMVDAGDYARSQPARDAERAAAEYRRSIGEYHTGGVIEDQTSSSGNWLHKLLNLGVGEIPIIAKQGELVLKNPVSAISNLLSSIKMPDFSNIKMAGTSSGTVDNSLHVNFDGFNGTKEDANFVVNKINNLLKNRGK